MNKKKRKAKREALKAYKRGNRRRPSWNDLGMTVSVSQVELRLSAMEKEMSEMLKKLHMKNRLS